MQEGKIFNYFFDFLQLFFTTAPGTELHSNNNTYDDGIFLFKIRHGINGIGFVSPKIDENIRINQNLLLHERRLISLTAFSDISDPLGAILHILSVLPHAAE